MLNYTGFIAALAELNGLERGLWWLSKYAAGFFLNFYWRQCLENYYLCLLKGTSEYII